MTDPVSPPFIGGEIIKQILSYADLIPSIEKVLARFSSPPEVGGIIQPLRSVIQVSGAPASADGYLLCMPGYSRHDDALVTKLLTMYPDNKDMPTLQSTIALFHPANGRLLCLVEGNQVTGMRTAAASAVAVRHLGPWDLWSKKGRSVAIVGTGFQAEMHALAMDALGSFLEIRLAGRSQERLQELAKRLPSPLPHGTSVILCDSIQSACSNADVIVTVTAATKPILDADWVTPGCLIICVGACVADAQELDPVLMKKAAVYADSKVSALAESGDVIINGMEVLGELGEVIDGKLDAPRKWFHAEETKGQYQYVVFKSLGIAIEDAVATKLVYDKWHESFKN